MLREERAVSILLTAVERIYFFGATGIGATPRRGTAKPVAVAALRPATIEIAAAAFHVRAVVIGSNAERSIGASAGQSSNGRSHWFAVFFTAQASQLAAAEGEYFLRAIWLRVNPLLRTPFETLICGSAKHFLNLRWRHSGTDILHCHWLGCASA